MDDLAILLIGHDHLQPMPLTQAADIEVLLHRVGGGDQPDRPQAGGKHGVSQQTFDLWKTKYAGLGLSELRELRQLREEVGNDACRLFYLMRSHDQPLDFDLELAKSRSNENPVYYLQYAHARVASVRRQLESRAVVYDQALALQSLDRLESPYEQAALAALARYPEVLAQAAAARAPHALVHYLRELATAFHSWYNAATFIVEDGALRNARLALAYGVQQVLYNGLTLLGVCAPESM